jgi:hypothetical protein
MQHGEPVVEAFRGVAECPVQVGAEHECGASIVAESVPTSM